MNSKTKRLGAVAVCAIVLVAGLVFYARKQMGVGGVDALNMYTSLGLFMVAFLFFEAVAAGAFFFAAIEPDEELRRPLAMVGVVAIVCSGISVTADAGSPQRFWELWISPMVKSPIFLDIVTMTLVLVLGIALIAVSAKKTAPVWLRAVLGVIAALMPIGTSLIFTGMSAALGFESLLEIAYFLLHSALAGVLVELALRISLGKEGDIFRKGAVVLLSLYVLFSMAEVLLCFYRTDTTMMAAKGMITGPYAPLFWVTLVVGFAVPAVMLAKGVLPKPAVALACLGVFGAKMVYIFKGNMYPYVDFGSGINIPMLSQGANGFQMTPVYVPTVQEWVICLAFFAVFIAALLCLMPKVMKGHAA